jgi:hypothetical protein
MTSDLPLSQAQLCVHLGLDYRNVAAIAKYLGMTTHDYLQAKTGWRLYDERYYPPGVSLSAIAKRSRRTV